MRVHLHPEIDCDACDAERAELLAKFRALLQAERDYSSAIHERINSRYGSERRNRNVEAARARRDALAKELGL